MASNSCAIPVGVRLPVAATPVVHTPRPAALPSRPSAPSSSPTKPPVPYVQPLPTTLNLSIKKRKLGDGPGDGKTELEIAKEELEAAKARIRDLEDAAKVQNREEAGARQHVGKIDGRLKDASRMRLGVGRGCDGKALVKAFETTIKESNPSVSLLATHSAFFILARDLLTKTPPQKLPHDPTRDAKGDRLPFGWTSVIIGELLYYWEKGSVVLQSAIPPWPMELDETKEELQALVVATELLGSQAALPNGIFDSKKVEKLKPASRRILGVAESCKGPELIEALRKSVKNLTRPDCSVTAIQSAFIVLALDLLVAPSSSSNPTVSPLSNPTSYSKAPSESTTETLTSEILAREDLARAHADLEQSNKMLQKARQDLALSKKKEEQASTESERKATEAISKLDRVKAKLARANADLLEANEKATKLQDGLRLAKKKEKIAAVEFASRKHQWKIVVDELQDETRDLRDEVEGLEAQARANELSSASKISEYMSIITQLGENVKTLSAEVKKRMDENAGLLVTLGEKA